MSDIIKPMDIPSLRLSNQHLTGNKFDDVGDLVDYFGALQSQDFPAAKWSLGLRLKNTTNLDIENAYNEGKILRTHILRPTWHFISPQNLVWIQKLTSSRVKQLMGHYNNKLDLTPKIFTKSNAVITKALQNHNYLTRQELRKALEGVGIKADLQRLAHLMIWAELEGLITSGPLRGKQFTYALVDERIARTKNPSREEALARLTLKYFQSHGPAQLKDFAWWSGLTTKEAGVGISLVESKLVPISLNGKAYWFLKGTGNIEKKIKKIFLLSVYDEYFIGITDRSDILDKEYRSSLPIGNALLTSLLIIDGKVEGTWKRKINKNRIEFKIYPFKTINLTVKKAVEKEAADYAKFFGYEDSSMSFAK